MIIAYDINVAELSAKYLPLNAKNDIQKMNTDFDYLQFSWRMDRAEKNEILTFLCFSTAVATGGVAITHLKILNEFHLFPWINNTFNDLGIR